jgi:ribosomal protein S18 acetylase RimI-like enzyme
MIPSVPEVLDIRRGRPVVRLATPADAGHLVAFNQAMAWETEHKRLDPDVLGRGVAAVFEQPARGRYWVAEVGGAVQGGLLVTYEWSDWRDGDWWWIQSVYVRPEARGQGVFRALYRHVEVLARAAPGVVGLRLYVERGNEPAQRVYRALGMADSSYLVYQDWFRTAR